MSAAPEASWPVVGVDVAKDTLAVCLLTEPRQRCTVPNTPAGHTKLFAWLQARGASQAVLAMEATGPYGLALAAAAYALDHRVAVLNPRHVADFCQKKRRRNKTDKADAEYIARYAAEDCRHGSLPWWQPTPPPQAKLRALMRRQADLQQAKRAEHCRAKTAEPGLQPSHQRFMASILAELKLLEKELQAHLRQEPDLAEDIALLMTIPGVGEKNARWLAAELPRHFRNGRAVAAWLSVVPCQEHSGTSVHRPGHIATQAPALRAQLHFTAIVNKNRDPRVQAFVARLAAKGKAPLAIAYAALNKLIRAAFALLKHRQPYDFDHVYQPAQA